MAIYSKNAATEPLWELVCGFAGRQRDWRWLLMPKAYIDDSGKHGHSPIFVLSGWAAPVETWIPFSVDWQTALDINPPLKYFRAYEAAHCIEQFAHFSKERRDQRVRILCDVLDKHLPVQISCVVVLSDFDRLIKTTTLPEWAHNPYYLAFLAILTFFARDQKGLGFTEPMDFVFDNQAEKKKIREWWDEFIEYAPADIKPFIGNEPNFLDDRSVKPLQAADMMAWQWREWNSALIMKDLKKTLNVSLPLFLGDYKGYHIYLDEPKLRLLLGDAIKCP